jgi:hypothetical protein
MEYSGLEMLFQIPLTITIAAPLCFSLLYFLAFGLLKTVPPVMKLAALGKWALPVRSRPIRSIGIVAGGIVFLFVVALHTFDISKGHDDNQPNFSFMSMI